MGTYIIIKSHNKTSVLTQNITSVDIQMVVFRNNKTVSHWRFYFCQRSSGVPVYIYIVYIDIVHIAKREKQTVKGAKKEGEGYIYESVNSLYCRLNQRERWKAKDRAIPMGINAARYLFDPAYMMMLRLLVMPGYCCCYFYIAACYSASHTIRQNNLVVDYILPLYIQESVHHVSQNYIHRMFICKTNVYKMSRSHIIWARVTLFF